MIGGTDISFPKASGGHLFMDFDQKARHWDSNPVKIKRAKTIADEIIGRVPLSVHMTALEYGCGTGLLSFALHPYLGQIALADSSPGMLTLLKEKIVSSGLKNMIPLRLDLTIDALPTERYDLIYTLMTLHHVVDMDKVLIGFYHLLNRPGLLCLVDLDREDGSFHTPEDHAIHSGFDRDELAEHVTRAGFQKIDFKTVHEMTKGKGHGMKTYTLFLMVAEKI
jgi:ubiquinone/menaquinone biosynthesis C-methylase UbiE